jgi:cob(I)alamin adenosyltransferase
MAQALRAAGQGTPVLVVQFLKGGIQQGPEHALVLGSYLTWVRCGILRCVDTPHLEPEEQAALSALWAFAHQSISSGHYGLVVLDELALAIQLGLIPEQEVLDLLDRRPLSLDVMITGLEMPQSLLDRADLITQLRHR